MITTGKPEIQTKISSFFNAYLGFLHNTKNNGLFFFWELAEVDI